MIVEYIRYSIDIPRQESFLEAYLEASEFLNKSEYCLAYELTHCEEDSKNFILRIEWTSTQDHLNGFRKSTDFIQFLNLVKPFFNDIEEMNHYKMTKVLMKK